MPLHITFSCLFALAVPSFCEREHKVHNIVLYPEKHSWCNITKIEQIVTMPGYEPTTIENNVCVGTCYSYSIPRTEPAEPGELIGPYCDSCQPANSKCYHVTLKADGKGPGPATAKKRVQIIAECACQSCSRVEDADCELPEARTAELPSGLLSAPANVSHPNGTRPDDVPELLTIDRALNVSVPSPEPLDEDVNDVLRKKLAQSLRATAGHVDAGKGGDVLRQLLGALEDPRNRFTDDNLLSLFTASSVDHVDLERIGEILLGVRRERELAERHRGFAIGSFVPIDGSKRNADLVRDIESLGKAYGGKPYGIEGLGHYKGAHVDTNAIPGAGRKPHHHFIGEMQDVGLAGGRLTKGPHGSLVVVPDSVKPNEEGLIIQYE